MPSSFNCGSPTDATPGEALDAVEDPLRRLRVAVHVDDDRDRPVEARPESLGEQVVRAPSGLLRRLRALVGRAEPDEPGRRGEREHERASTTGKTIFAFRVTNRPQRATSVRSRPASESSSFGQERELEPVDLVAEQPQHRDQERVREEHGRQHAERAADPELRHEVEPEEREPADADRDREAREEHGAAGGGAGLAGCVLRRQPFVQQLPEPRHDEERVVDPDAEPDHRDEDRRDRVDVGQAREDEEQEERRRERDDREHDRDERRHERPEDDQQHDDRREETEQLGGALLDRRELGVAVVLDRHAHRRDRLAHGVLHGDDRLAVLVVDHAVELRLGVCDPPVLGERLLAERVADAREPCLLLGRLELGGLQARDRLVDRGLALGRVEPLALGRGEDEVEDAALLVGELRLDQVGRPLRVGARDLELVPQRAADGRDEPDEDDDDRQPAEDDTPRVGRAETRPAREPSCRETLVRELPPVTTGFRAVLRHQAASRFRFGRSTRPVGHRKLIALGQGIRDLEP